ncbi:uncharacterized protein [Coffea arabica]|uniref:Ubiquitin-like protease family profile domain-containing protein n=1 Tax=Coffea arabica TaxID=13443 RepID=A0ABM4UF57_COFAR
MTCLTFFIPHLAQILVPVCIEGSWFVYSFGVSEKEVHVLDPDSSQAKSKDISVLNRLKRSLGLVVAAKFGKEIDFSSFGFSVADVPHHSPNKVCDSGVFVMTFLEHWSGRLAVRLTEENVGKYRVLYTARLCNSAENSKFPDSFANLQVPKRAQLNVGNA